MESIGAERRRELIMAQRDLADKMEAPCFLPYSGVCYRCGCDLVEEYGEALKTMLITGCVKCLFSYCE